MTFKPAPLNDQRDVFWIFLQMCPKVENSKKRFLRTAHKRKDLKFGARLNKRLKTRTEKGFQNLPQNLSSTKNVGSLPLKLREFMPR